VANGLHQAHWEGLSDNNSESGADILEPQDNIPVEDNNAFEILMRAFYVNGEHQQHHQLAVYEIMRNAAAP
jgi:hypothetical protein